MTTGLSQPESYWMRMISGFPECEDLRPEWWRLFSYQFVHAGYEHIAFNIFMQVGHCFAFPLTIPSLTSNKKYRRAPSNCRAFCPGCTLQTLFGMPLNLVHGNLRFGLIYELGVIGGAITFAITGGAGALVGCSGGVYCVLGMMIAELIINWDSSSKGLLNHWTRLGIIAGKPALNMHLSLSRDVLNGFESFHMSLQLRMFVSIHHAGFLPLLVRTQ